MKLNSQLAVLALVLGAASVAHAAPVNVFVGTVAAGDQTVNFDSLAGGSLPGTAYNNVVAVDGVRFGERFAGQTAAAASGFDILSGSPSGPLSLLAGATNANLAVVQFPSAGSLTNQVLAGVGPVLFPDTGGLGTGAISVLFAADQSEFGFQVLGTQLGSAQITFFRRNGTLIDSLVLSGLQDTNYAFRREGGVLDIAGVSLTNSDPGGFGIDNFRFTLSPGTGQGTPEPGTLALAGLALLGAYALRRQTRR